MNAVTSSSGNDMGADMVVAIHMTGMPRAHPSPRLPIHCSRNAEVHGKLRCHQVHDPSNSNQPYTSLPKEPYSFFGGTLNPF